MTQASRVKLFVLALGALVLVGGGCLLSDQNKPVEEGREWPEIPAVIDTQSEITQPDTDSNSQVSSQPGKWVPPPEPAQVIVFAEGFRFKYPINPDSSICRDEPTESEIGSVDYPIAPQYRVYDRFFGALLTQYQCPKARREMAIGTNETYDLGLNLGLKQAPSENLLQTLKKIGFSCTQKVADAECMAWELGWPAPVYNLIHIEPFTDEVSGSDCINCG